MDVMKRKNSDLANTSPGHTRLPVKQTFFKDLGNNVYYYACNANSKIQEVTNEEAIIICLYNKQDNTIYRVVFIYKVATLLL